MSQNVINVHALSNVDILGIKHGQTASSQTLEDNTNKNTICRISKLTANYQGIMISPVIVSTDSTPCSVDTYM